MPTWNPRANDLFLQALALRSPGERANYLDQACAGDTALAREVEALLAASARAGSFLEAPAAVVAATIDDPAGEYPAGNDATRDAVGSVIGPYKLLEQIGEGGFGVVYLAEQTQPIRRKVALKILKPGMDTRQVVARFEAERQALAIMDHPNIAKIYDGGTTEPIADSRLQNADCKSEISNLKSAISRGRPYFVMELVEGVPITDYCDQAQLTPRQRLELFIPVCQAVQHAHQKGIIHRDLKPSNVLVAVHDAQPAPKVIDFGIAKALGQELTDKTIVTAQAQMVGTPLYMSPEQAGHSGLDIDTRSDIYSLGVLLYELLTGTTPFTRERFKKAGYDEMRRIIREEEPPKPSTRLLELHHGDASPTSPEVGVPGRAGGGATTSLESVSVLRHTEPGKLRGLVRGELDWIVMKCLEKDRNRRYESASAMAVDIARFLADEPVLAGPPSASYRLRKFVKRHRGPVLAAALVLLALVAGIVGTTWGLVEAEQARLDEAEQRQAAQASAAKAREEEEKAKAARNEAQHLAREEKTSRERAEKQLLRAEWLLYANQISMTQQTLENQNLDLAGHHLSTCRADFIGWEYSYLFYQIQNRRHRALPPPIKPPAVALFQNAAMSYDGRRLATATWDGTFAVWDAATGKELWTIPGGHPRLAVTSLAFSMDGLRIIGNHGHKVMVWDAVTGKVRRNLQLHKGASSIRAALLPYRASVLSFNQDGTITTWDGAGASTTRRLEGFEFVLPTRAALSADGRHVLYGGETGTIQVWDAATGRKTLTLKGHAGPVITVAMNRDGKRIVSGSLDQMVKVWDATTGKELLTLKGHTGPVGQVAWLEDGKRIASGSFDKTVKIWDAVTGFQTMILQGYSPSFLAVSPDGKCLLGTGPDRALKIWDAGHRRPLP